MRGADTILNMRLNRKAPTIVYIETRPMNDLAKSYTERPRDDMDLHLDPSEVARIETLDLLMRLCLPKVCRKVDHVRLDYSAHNVFTSPLVCSFVLSKESAPNGSALASYKADSTRPAPALTQAAPMRSRSRSFVPDISTT